MNLALWIVAIVLAAAFAGSGLMKLSVPKEQTRQVRPGLGAGFQPEQHPTDRICRGTRRGWADLASRHTHRTNPRPAGSHWLGSRNGGCGNRSRSTARSDEYRGQRRAPGTGRLRGLGQVRPLPVRGVDHAHLLRRGGLSESRGSTRISELAVEFSLAAGS